MDERGVIGKKNKLPWHLSSDLKRFSQLTMGHCIVMGRKTFETIGKQLPGRRTLIITHQTDYSRERCVIVNSLPDAIKYGELQQEQELFIIGGGEIYNQALSLADRLYITTVHTKVNGDTIFPKISPDEWEIITTENISQNNADDYASTFQILQRKSKA